MNQLQILSENFQNLELVAKKEKENYLNAKPFPNIVISNFFKSDFLNSILEEFPDLSKISKSENYNVRNEVKLSNKNYKEFPQTIKSLIVF